MVVSQDWKVQSLNKIEDFFVARLLEFETFHKIVDKNVYHKIDARLATMGVSLPIWKFPTLVWKIKK